MNKNNVFVFVVGAAVGSLATWLYMKNKVELLQAELNDLEEYYVRCDEYDSEEEAPEDEEGEEPHDETVNGLHVKPNIMEYAKRVQDQGYVDYSGNPKSAAKPKEVDDVERPYVISPEEFGEIGYSTMSLTYYNDGVLTDEDGDIIEDVDDIVGRDSLDTFGDYEEDSVFVRDDRKKTDYEILADERNYSDVFKTDPHPAEGE